MQAVAAVSKVIAFTVNTFAQYDINIIPTDIKYIYTVKRCSNDRRKTQRAAKHPEKKKKNQFNIVY